MFKSMESIAQNENITLIAFALALTLLISALLIRIRTASKPKPNVHQKSTPPPEAVHTSSHRITEEIEPFNAQRLFKMGFSQDEIDTFTQELYLQIKAQLPRLHTALEQDDVKFIEETTHSLKGAALNIGSGGVAQILSEFNLYLKTQSEHSVIRDYLKILEKELSKHETL